MPIVFITKVGGQLLPTPVIVKTSLKLVSKLAELGCEVVLFPGARTGRITAAVTPVNSQADVINLFTALCAKTAKSSGRSFVAMMKEVAKWLVPSSLNVSIDASETNTFNTTVVNTTVVNSTVVNTTNVTTVNVTTPSLADLAKEFLPGPAPKALKQLGEFVVEHKLGLLVGVLAVGGGLAAFSKRARLTAAWNYYWAPSNLNQGTATPTTVSNNNNATGTPPQLAFSHLYD
jgi:hypothetical protein